MVPLQSSQYEISSAYHKTSRYLRRILKFEQMDFEFALWQMFYLFVAPQKLTKLFRARKNSKSQYARDDPAFLILFSCALALTSVGFAVVLGLGFLQFLKFLMLVIFVDCVGLGVLIATLLWYLTNRFLKPKNTPQDVEWGLAFDIHLNAFFPPIILLHCIQLFFYNGYINHEWFVSILLGNTFWLAASVYYIYITFLGYNSMQLLNGTNLFLAPIPWLAFAYVITLVCRVNISHIVLNFYKYRVL
ncbi:protein unc-50 homolog [Cylas formicarius]|uniref:protein unc-50 homolog n=1 Tax=Cylas formicarius TaxID=197179 RepID=UPI002958C622|nr:protein unc-50 homolog [Cylas formicarius]